MKASVNFWCQTEIYLPNKVGLGFSPGILVPRGTGNFGDEYFSPGFPEIPRLYFMASMIFTEIYLF